MRGNNRPDLRTHLLRQDLVQHYWRLGLSIPEMMQRLEIEGLLATTQTYAAQYAIVSRLLKTVKHEAAKSYTVTPEDNRQAWREYVDRQTFLYYQAVQSGDLALAGELSKDLARAHGINTDEPIVIKTDLMTMLKNAQEQARKKLEARRSIIDVTPISPCPIMNNEIASRDRIDS